MTTLVFLLEEPSARDLLEGLLPRMLPAGIVVRYMVFEGKQDLEKKMGLRLRGWLLPDTKFVILRDQDAQPNCRLIKQKLRKIATDDGQQPEALIRIACRDLESWILGDLRAVGQAFERPGIEKNQNKALYRTPDAISNAVEELRKFIPTYQKRDGARRVGVLLDPETNASASFRQFCSGVIRLVQSNSPPPAGTSPEGAGPQGSVA